MCINVFNNPDICFVFTEVARLQCRIGTTPTGKETLGRCPIPDTEMLHHEINFFCCRNGYAHTQTCTHKHTHTCIHAHTHTCTHTCMHTCTCTRICAHSQVRSALKSQDNHTYLPSEDPSRHLVLHRNRKDWMFTVTQRGNKWVCHGPHGERCWRNVRLGRPCEHITMCWHNMLRETPPTLDLSTIEMSFHKIYRRVTYTDIVPVPYTAPPPPPKPAVLKLDDSTRLHLSKVKQQLQFMLAVTNDTDCQALTHLQRLINRCVLVLHMVDHCAQRRRCALHTYCNTCVWVCTAHPLTFFTMGVQCTPHEVHEFVVLFTSLLIITFVNVFTVNCRANHGTTLNVFNPTNNSCKSPSTRHLPSQTLCPM